MSNNLGDFAPGDVIDFKFCTVGITGAPNTFSGTPTLAVYKGNGTTESTAGITLSVDFDSRTGMNHVRITTSSDTSFYAAGGEYDVVVTAGTSGGTSIVGYVVGHFSIQNRAGAFIRKNTAAAGASGSITLDSGAVATDDYYNDNLVRILSGTGANQVRRITDYVGSTQVASVKPNWATTPDSTSVFVILPSAQVNVNEIEGADATDQIRDSIFNGVVENSKTFVQLVRGMWSVLGNKVSGLSGSTASFRDDADTKDRIVATVDSDGNRSAITKDLT